MTASLFADIIEVANRFGESEYSRAGGGNASVKVDGVLHIKPSGVPLTLTAAEPRTAPSAAPPRRARQRCARRG